MIRSLLIAGAILLSGSLLFGQNQENSAPENEQKNPVWTFKGLSSLNITQVALSNWNGGGNSAVSANALGNYAATYAKGKTKWENTLNVGYGIQNTEENGTRKTDDKLEFNSKFGTPAYKKWRYTSILNFRTQFQPGFQYPNDTTEVKISNWLAPGYVNFSVGLSNHPFDWLDIYFSPLSSKLTLVMDEELSAAGSFGVEAGENFRYELGGILKIGINADIMENVNYTSALELFSNYAENPQNIDVNWDNIMSFQVNKFLSASLAWTVIYDDDIKLPVDANDDGVTDYTAPRTQLKQVISLGIQHKF